MPTSFERGGKTVKHESDCDTNCSLERPSKTWKTNRGN